MSDYQLASGWVAALGGGAFNWRFIHDQDKARPAIKRRGTLEYVWQEACAWNQAGYGIFATVNEMDGAGYDGAGQPIQGARGDTLEHVQSIRAHVVDLDNLSAMENLQRAAQHQPAPWFAVQTSPNKAHVYWPVYGGSIEQYSTIQRKLRQLFDGDKAVIDATRVLRVPGFWHQKGAPHLVTWFGLPGWSQQITFDALAASLAHVNAIAATGGRHRLGDPEMSAPSADWLWYALDNMPIDGMSHPDFISFTAAYKQAGWTVADPDELRDRWLAWCERFGQASKGLEYNLKHWNSIEDTEIGWKSLLRQNPTLNGMFMFGGAQHVPPARVVSDVPPAFAASPSADLPMILDSNDCATYFKDCTFIVRNGMIRDTKGQMLNSTQFNGKFGGPRFIISPTGQPTDEPWKAATRSVFWRVPTVDYLRFLPHETPGKIVTDELGRSGLNTYIPPAIITQQGDPSPFLRHMELLFPTQSDMQTYLHFIAHNAQYPGHKIPWAPLLQSAEGAGKGIIKALFSYLVGSTYFHSPNAQELIESGQKFNAWMRNKLFIFVDEIRVDERRDMIEVLKPMITEHEIEIQGKGDNQEKEDNYANWAFLSNYKDAIPVNQNSRRFAIFYSAIQSAQDLIDRGMNDAYFLRLMNWFNLEGGKAILANFFRHEFTVSRGSLPHRAPVTSSHAEAVRQGRTPVERAILEAIDSTQNGFRGGWVSSIAVNRVLQKAGLKTPGASAIERIIEGLGFYQIGRSHRPFMQDGTDGASILFHTDRTADAGWYGRAQGYE